MLVKEQELPDDFSPSAAFSAESSHHTVLWLIQHFGHVAVVLVCCWI